MEFLLFLGASEKEILKIIQQAGYSAEENTPLCLLGKEYFGFFKRHQKKIVICTQNAKIMGGYFIPSLKEDEEINKTAIYIKRALRHESVHVAQHCNEGNLLEIDSKKEIKINPYKIEALKGSTRISGKRSHEYQAYALEDKPNLVIKALKKYCL